MDIKQLGNTLDRLSDVFLAVGEYGVSLSMIPRIGECQQCGMEIRQTCGMWCKLEIPRTSCRLMHLVDDCMTDGQRTALEHIQWVIENTPKIMANFDSDEVKYTLLSVVPSSRINALFREKLNDSWIKARTYSKYITNQNVWGLLDLRETADDDTKDYLSKLLGLRRYFMPDIVAEFAPYLEEFGLTAADCIQEKTVISKPIKTFDALIIYPDKDKLKARLHELVDNNPRPRNVGLILLTAKSKGYIVNTPNESEYYLEFGKSLKYDSVRKYFNHNNYTGDVQNIHIFDDD